MSELFFDPLINLKNLHGKIRALSLAGDELQEVEEQIDELIQHRVVEVILDLLHEDHHHTFITYLHEQPNNPEVLSWLKEQIEDIENQISTAITKLEKELIAELFATEENE